MESLTTQDGRTLTYHLVGEGPTLVCHPGGPGFSSRYFGDLAELTESLTLVLLDPRGTGASDRPADPRAYRTEDYAADLDELRAHLGLEQLPLLGHSHGGVVATAYAGRYPHRVERLVLASALARFQAEQEGAMQRAMEAKSREPWYADARAALEAEQAGQFETDEELAAPPSVSSRSTSRGTARTNAPTSRSSPTNVRTQTRFDSSTTRSSRASTSG